MPRLPHQSPPPVSSHTNPKRLEDVVHAQLLTALAAARFARRVDPGRGVQAEERLAEELRRLVQRRLGRRGGAEAGGIIDLFTGGGEELVILGRWKSGGGVESCVGGFAGVGALFLFLFLVLLLHCC